jgi:hypothetical protein
MILCPSINIIWMSKLKNKNRADEPCGTYREKRIAYGIFVGKLEGSRPLGRPRRRWENNIKYIS